MVDSDDPASYLFIYFWGGDFYFFFNFTILYWFCHISKWIHHKYTCVPHPELSSLLPSHTIPLGHPSVPAPSIQYRASNLDWQLVSYMILYMFQCHSPKSSHPLPLPYLYKFFNVGYSLFCRNMDYLTLPKATTLVHYVDGLSSFSKQKLKERNDSYLVDCLISCIY